MSKFLSYGRYSYQGRRSCGSTPSVGRPVLQIGRLALFTISTRQSDGVSLHAIQGHLDHIDLFPCEKRRPRHATVDGCPRCSPTGSGPQADGLTGCRVPCPGPIEKIKLFGCNDSGRFAGIARVHCSLVIAYCSLSSCSRSFTSDISLYSADSLAINHASPVCSPARQVMSPALLI